MMQIHLTRRGAGQAGLEAIIVTVGMVALFFGLAWWDGSGGLAGVWLHAMRAWYARFAAALAMPV